jgi:hypothetical protein
MILRTVFAGCLALLTVGCVAIGATSGRVAIKTDNTVQTESFFNARDRSLIQEHFRNKPVPPGLAKRGKLPPGFVKRDALPSGHPGERLPHELESKLSSLPLNYVRMRVGQDVVVMDAKTRVVLDILYAVGK